MAPGPGKKCGQRPVQWVGIRVAAAFAELGSSIAVAFCSSRRRVPGELLITCQVERIKTRTLNFT
eukprot:195517-Hanusia_phi.AAC.6